MIARREGKKEHLFDNLGRKGKEKKGTSTTSRPEKEGRKNGPSIGGKKKKEKKGKSSIRKEEPSLILINTPKRGE